MQKISYEKVLKKKKVKRKVSKQKFKKCKEPADYSRRTYNDYLEYKIQNPNIPTTEMDAVYNMQSVQKPHVENNHNFIREILPNGKDLSNLTQDKVDLMFSHINSTPRESLGDKTPYEVFTFIYGRQLADKLNIQKIAKDEVNTTPRLF